MDFCIGLFLGCVLMTVLRAVFRPRPAPRQPGFPCPLCQGTGVISLEQLRQPVTNTVPQTPTVERATKPARRSGRVKLPAPASATPPALPENGGGPPEDLFAAGITVPSKQDSGEHPQLPKLRAFVQLGLAAARADGRIAAGERKAIREFLTENFGHDAALLRHVDPVMEKLEKKPIAEIEVFAAVVAVTSEGERFAMIRLAERVLDSTGKRTAKKKQFRERVISAMRIVEKTSPPEQTREVPPPVAVPPPPPVDHRAVLEIDASVELAPDLIRRRFVLLSEKLDPGKASAMGGDFARLAEEKRVALRLAAETLIAPFGVPLDPPAAPPPPADIRHNPDLDDIFGG